MTDVKQKYQRYIAQVTFWRIEGGTIPIIARTPEEAAEILPKMLSHVKDVEVHSIVPESEFDYTIPEVSSDPSPAGTGGMMVN